MRSVCLAILLVLSHWISASAEECGLDQLVSLTLEDNEDHVPVVTIKIDDAPLKVVVATSQEMSVLHDSWASAHGVRKDNIGSHLEVFNEDGQVRRFATARSMKIGEIDVPDMKFVVIDSGPESKVDGVLGGAFWSLFDLDLNFGAKKLNLMSPKHCEGRVVYWTNNYVVVPFKFRDSNEISFPVILDGKKINAVLSTGAPTTLLRAPHARDIFGLTADSPGAEVDDPELAAREFWYRFNSLSFQGETAEESVTVKNPRIFVHQDLAAKALKKNHQGEKTRFDPRLRIDVKSPDLMLGTNVLSKLHIYVAYNEKKIYLSAAESAQ